MAPVDIPTYIFELSSMYPILENTMPMRDIGDGSQLRTYGVKEERFQTLGDPTMTDEQASIMILMQMDNFLKNRFEGYSDAPKRVKQMMLDATYTVGEKEISSWNKLRGSVKEGNWVQAAKNVLDTANAEGKSMIGIARRRAWSANLVLGRMPVKVFGQELPEKYANMVFDWLPEDQKVTNVHPIREITQDDTGKIQYKDIDGDVFFEYTAKNGRHPESISSKAVPFDDGFKLGEPHLNPQARMASEEGLHG